MSDSEYDNHSGECSDSDSPSSSEEAKRIRCRKRNVSYSSSSPPSSPDRDRADPNCESESKSKSKKAKIDLSKQKHRDQKFRAQWEKSFEWITSSPKGNHYFRCKACFKDLKGGLTEAKRHEQRRDHQKNEMSIKNSVKNFFKTSEKERKLEEQARKNEITGALMLAEHDISFAFSDHLFKWVKSLDPNSEVLKRMSCGKTKATAIIQNVIGVHELNETISALKSCKFSIMIDETTDVGTIKQLVVIARYQTDGVVRDHFLALLQPAQFDHQTIYKDIVDFFTSNEIPYKDNMVGFASDGASTMQGRFNSVATLFKNDIPNLFVLKCTCHSLALCASAACLQLPESVEKLLRHVLNYIRSSSKRVMQFERFQLLLELPKHQLLKLCRVRWLSMYQCIHRVLEQLAAIIMFFEEEHTHIKDKHGNSEVKDMLNALKHPVNIAYFEFLDYILPYINNLNLQFQSEKPQIHALFVNMRGLYRTVIEGFIDDRFIDNRFLAQLDIFNKENYLPCEKIQFGPKAHTTITRNFREGKIKPNELNDLQKRIQNFYIELARQIRSRFPFSDSEMDVLEYCGFVEPTNLKTISSIAPLCSFFKQDCQDIVGIDNEYKLFRNTYKDNYISNPDEFWEKVEIQNKTSFSNIIALKNIINILPHSSAACERIFSSVNNIKTNKRNKLASSSLNGLLQSRQFLVRTNSNCYDAINKIPPEMLKLHTSKKYDK